MLVKALFLLAVIVAVVAAIGSGVDAQTVNFNNGSTIQINPAFFVGSFPNIQQTGLAPNTYAWELSLAQASNFGGACPSSYYAAQGSKCDQTTFPNAADSILPNSDGSGIQFIFKTTVNSNPWQGTFNVICDPTANTLTSPSMSYQASQPATTIVVAFTLTSKGACIGAAPGPGPAPGDDKKDEGGITWGGVFLILFFVPLTLYVVGMVAWNYKQGMTGKDLAPHPDFWKSLPGLAKDGVTFLIAKARGTAWTPSESSSSAGTESAAGATSGGYAAV